jgi:hypothetical protein
MFSTFYFNLSPFMRRFLLPTLAFLLSSCAAGRHFYVIENSEATKAPRYLELRSEASAATLHFPAGVYSLYAADAVGCYYRAPRKIAEHTGAGSVWHDGGIFVNKRNPKKLRGYIFRAGALTHIGNLSGAQHEFHD